MEIEERLWTFECIIFKALVNQLAFTLLSILLLFLFSSSFIAVTINLPVYNLNFNRCSEGIVFIAYL